MELVFTQQKTLTVTGMNMHVQIQTTELQIQMVTIVQHILLIQVGAPSVLTMMMMTSLHLRCVVFVVEELHI